jgi:thiamine biosynthesis lipoprotein
MALRRTSVESLNLGMDTTMTHRAFGRHAAEALQAVKQEAARLEGMLSRFLPGSEIAKINGSAGHAPCSVSRETFDVLSCATQLSAACQGIFDATIGPLVDLWSIGHGALRPPADADIRRALGLVDYADLLLDPVQRTAGLRRAGQSVDLGGIGKGYAADRFIQIFQEYGVSSAFTNIGGNVAALGARPDGSAWRVGIQHPRQPDALIGLVSVKNKAVVTSGDYQRFFDDGDGNRCHHILDPTTGYPSKSGLAGATVVASSPGNGSMVADALSTAVFIAGLDKGLALIGRYPGTGAILVDTEMSVWVTRNLKGCFVAAQGMSAVTIL